MNLLSMAAAAAMTAATAPASQAAPPDVGSAYGANGAARWFINLRNVPGGGSALQFTDITDGTVRILREEGGWYVGGPSLTSFDPVTLRIRFLPGAIRMCGAASDDCTVVPQIPLRQEDVRFNSRGVELNGTIWLPADVGRYPAVALAQGSEDTDRHGMDPLPQVLASRGFAVLAYDKRGTGQSAGEWEDQGIEDLAADLKTAFRSVLLGHGEVRPDAAGVIGFSEGPWVAVEAQRKGAGFRYLVAISGGASTKGASFLDKEAAKLRDQGLSGPELELAMRPHRETIAAATGRARAGGTASGFDRRVAYDPTEA